MTSTQNFRFTPHSLRTSRPRSLRVSLRAWRPRTASWALLMATSLAFTACGSEQRSEIERPEDNGKIPGFPRERPSNGKIQLDESQLRATIEGSSLRLSVPLSSMGKQASGKLQVRLLSVDGKKDHGAVEMPYSLDAGKTGTFEAELRAPSGVNAQADLVHYKVRVEDGTSDGLYVTRSLLYVVPLLDLRVQGPSHVTAGRTGFYRVQVRDVLNGEPLAEQEVTLEILKDDQVVDTQTVTTERTGNAELPFDLDDVGAFQIRAKTTSEASGAPAELTGSLQVAGVSGKLLLTTDKPIYQPGQLVHLRSLALSHDGNKPVQKVAMTFEIEDAKGNKIFKKTLPTNDFGVAFSTFRLGNILNEGTFKVRVLGDDIQSEKTFEVRHYALPKFEVGVTTTKPWYSPGDTIEGGIDSRYFFGKAVSGTVTIEAYSLDVGDTLFQQVMGALSDEGHYDFSLSLPTSLPGLPLGQGDALVELRVTVTDSAGQEVQKSRLVTVSSHGASVAIVPESGRLVPGLENELLLFATDPLGAPLANAVATVTAPDGTESELQTDAFGQAQFSFTPDEDSTGGARFSVQLSLDGGKVVQQTFDFTSQTGDEHLLLRTDKSVYEVGEEVQVDIYSTESDGTVYVDWLNEGQTVDLRTLTAQDGKATFSASIDATLAGNNRVEAYLVNEDGHIVRTGRTLFVRTDSGLSIQVKKDKSIYAPGAPAQLTVSVADENGDPAVAAVGLQIVDQAVFSLIDAKPGLLRTYFELDEQFAAPSYELHAPAVNFPELLFNETMADDDAEAQAAQQRTAAAFAAMKNTTLSGMTADSLPETVHQAKALLKPYYDELQASFHKPLSQAVAAALAVLDARGCKVHTYECGNSNFYTELFAELPQHIMLDDFWGNAFSAVASYGTVTLSGLGPDEKAASGDEVGLTYSFSDLDIESELKNMGGPLADADGGILNGGPLLPAPNPGAGAGAGGSTSMASGGTSAVGDGDGDGDGDGGGDGPRVRRDFPETLYVNPMLITDQSGQATIDLQMADSITEWRLSALANSADGRLGGSESGITVFQDFFVDVNFPAQLTRGDEVDFPIAVYNYLEQEQSVQLELQEGSWYTALGQTSTSVTLQPGEVLGVSFPVRVETVGTQSLTVVATGEAESDAVARTVRVVPDGKAFPLAQSGSLSDPSTSYTVSFPAEAVPHSEQLYVDIFPAFLAQAVQGMDSILATPNGCFEQTTSSAWPNVLVTEYMKETGQITTEIELKAETLMSAGYQRLLTFEHEGGGFSWFGEQDPAPYLSVTAFGLMEFADMARVHQVDEAMIARTIAWLESQQQADGSFAGDMSEFFSFHTSELRNTAFTAWALASAGAADAAVNSALDYVKANLGSDNDAYTLAIVANAFVTAGKSSDAIVSDVFATLDALKKTEGDQVSWDSGDTQTNFYGRGNDAAVSATALVAHAMLLDNRDPNAVQGALAYLTSQKDPSGNFGSTQATIWALRTLLLSAKEGTDGAVGTLGIEVDGDTIQMLDLSEANSDVMTRVDLGTLATTGEHDITLTFAGEGKPSYNLVSSYHLPWAVVPAEPAGPLSIDVAYDKSNLFVADQVQATVTLANNEDVTQNMVLLTLGIAPGFQVETSDLQQYLDAGRISRFETTGRQLILYITALEPSASEVFEYHLTATMPVSAVDGGAEARLYYEPEKRVQQVAQALDVLPNGG